MKKILLFAAVAAMIAVAAQAHKSKYVGTGYGSEDVTWTAQQDTSMLDSYQHNDNQLWVSFGFPEKAERLTGSTGYKFIYDYETMIDCLFSPAEFNGIVTDSKGVQGTSRISLPAYAEITQISLSGWAFEGGYGGVVFLPDWMRQLSGRVPQSFNNFIFISDFAGNELPADDQKDSISSLERKFLANGKMITSKYTINQLGYMMGELWSFGDPNRGEMKFFTDNLTRPFTYTGKNNVRITCDAKGMDLEGFRYHCNVNNTSPITTATVHHFTGQVLEYDGLDSPYKTIVDKLNTALVPVADNTHINTKTAEWYGVPDSLKDLAYNIPLPTHSVPAFVYSYFTNDIKGKVTLLDEGKTVTTDDNPVKSLQPNGRPLVRLLDCTTGSYVMPDGATALNSKNSAEVNADGSFSFTALNPEHTYALSVSSSSYGYYQIDQLNFVEGENGVKSDADFDQAYEGKNNDIVANITLTKGTSTAVSDVTASKQVAGVDYYNMQGQRSSSAHNGVNVVVTRYTDGTKSVAKVVK